jgi:stringent starvation protein B
MSIDRQKLLTKHEALAELLRTQPTVLVHLDARIRGVVVPQSFKNRPDLVLQLGLQLPAPIRDLSIDEDEWSATLSFGRQPFFCIVPWKAVYLLMSPQGFGSAWDHDVPQEVLAKLAAAKTPPAVPAPAAPKAAARPARKLPPGWKVHTGGGSKT